MSAVRLPSSLFLWRALCLTSRMVSLSATCADLSRSALDNSSDGRAVGARRGSWSRHLRTISLRDSMVV
jgi:hypothetical protein